MDEWRRERHWGWGQCHCGTGCGHHSLTRAGCVTDKGLNWAAKAREYKHCLLSGCSRHAQGNAGLKAALNKLTTCQPAGERVSECPPSLSSTGTNIASTGSFCEGKSDGNSGKAAVIYTAPIQQQFSETVSKNTSPSPCFSSQNGHAVFSEDISLWKQLLTVGTNLTSSHRVFRPWFLMPSDALSSFSSASLA